MGPPVALGIAYCYRIFFFRTLLPKVKCLPNKLKVDRENVEFFLITIKDSFVNCYMSLLKRREVGLLHLGGRLQS